MNERHDKRGGDLSLEATLNMKRSTCVFAVCMAPMLFNGCGDTPLPVVTAANSAWHTASPTLLSASSGDLLYVSDAGSKVVEIYSYPQGRKVGQLNGFAVPEGLCVDAAGDIFVTNGGVTSGDSQILEFKHGGKKPILTLDDPGMLPSGCAVNPASGDLAVTNFCAYNQGGCSGRGNILIYPAAKGSPKSYSDSLVKNFYFCGYDDTGNFYADGSGRRGFKLMELPSGGGQLVTIRVRWKNSAKKIQNPGGVQWDGTFLAVGQAQVEKFNASVYRVAPATGRIARVVTLQRSFFVQQFFIRGGVLIAPNVRPAKSGQILFYNYPKVGRPTKTIGALGMPVGAVVSPG